MRIISVIDVENGVVTDINSFAIHEEQLSDDIVEKAEELFKKKVLELNPELDDDDIEEIIEDGFYEYENETICGVSLVWSYVD
jgi:hypothetical protein